VVWVDLIRNYGDNYVTERTQRVLQTTLSVLGEYAIFHSVCSPSTLSIIEVLTKYAQFHCANSASTSAYSAGLDVANKPSIHFCPLQK